MKLIKLDSKGVLERIDELLELSYRSADLGNFSDPLSETVYIMLSKQTREGVYRRIFNDLRKRFPLWLDVHMATNEDIAKLLEPGGFHRQRTSQLKKLLAAVAKVNAELGIGPSAYPPTDLTLDFLAARSDPEAERFLLSLPGIGPKSARCVLAYSLGRAAFGVDTHVHRIFSRLRLTTSNGRKRDHDPFQEAVPARMRKRLHMNMIHHGRAVCRTQDPKCGECVLVSFCVQGQRAIVADTRPVAVDLFGGAGGLGFGFRSANFRIGLAVEAERNAAQTYRLNNPGAPVIEAQINSTTSARGLRRYMPGAKRITALVAGPPCQGYSVAGTRNPHAPINLLYRDVARLAKQLRAEFVCLENVLGVRRVNGHGFLDSISGALRKAGFITQVHLVHACDFGVPQHRARYFFLGRRKERGPAPLEPIPTHHPQHKSSSSNTALGFTPRLIDLLSELPSLGPGVIAERWASTGNREDYNLSTMNHSPGVIKKIRAIQSGDGPISYRRLEPDEARTLIAGHRALPVHPLLDRTISVREAAIVQGFPRDYVFCGMRTSQPLQVANAVPPPLARAVARQILASMHR